MKSVNPKIIDFDSAGHLKLKDAVVNKILNFKEMVKYNKGFGVNDGFKLWNLTNVEKEIKKYIKSKLQPKKRIKALTYCIQDLRLCRFLFCPNIKENCVLCEVRTKSHHKNSTTCETFDTRFLIDHGLFEKSVTKKNLHIN